MCELIGNLRAPKRSGLVGGRCVADMDSFTATTARYGIVPFLMLIHQVEQLARPALERHRGQLLKSEADTLFCLFDTAEDALPPPLN